MPSRFFSARPQDILPTGQAIRDGDGQLIRIGDGVRAGGIVLNPRAPTFASLGIDGQRSSRDTDRLLAALNDHREVIVTQRPGGEPWMFDAPIKLMSGARLYAAQPGVVIKASPGRAPHEPVIGNQTSLPRTSRARDRDVLIANLIIDGAKQSNRRQGQWGHGVQLNAVDGAAILNLVVRNTQGDGLCLMYGYDPAASAPRSDVFCSNVRGNIRTEDAERQGVAVIAAEDVQLDVMAIRARLFGLDVEGDNNQNVARNLTFRLQAFDCGDGSEGSGGLAVVGAGSAGAFENISVEFVVTNSGGKGVAWREVRGLRLNGRISRPAGAGVWGMGGGAFGSEVQLDVEVVEPQGTVAALIGPGDVVNGRIRASGPSLGASSAVQVTGMAGGSIQLQMPDGGRQQGLTLDGCTGTTWTGRVNGFQSHGIWLGKGSSRNLFRNVDARGNNKGGFFADIVEEPSCRENRFENVDAATTNLRGRGSQFSGPVRQGVAALAFSPPPSVPGYSTAVAPVVVPGAMVGDEVIVTTNLHTMGHYDLLEGVVHRAGEVTVRYRQSKGEPAAAGSGTFAVFTRRQT